MPTKPPIQVKLQSRTPSNTQTESEYFVKSKAQPSTAVNIEVHRNSNLFRNKNSFQNKAPLSWQNFKSTTAKKVFLKDLVPASGMKIHEADPSFFEYLYPPLLGGFKDENYLMEDPRHRSVRNVDEETFIKLLDPPKLSGSPPKPPEENLHDQMYRHKLVLTIR